MEQPLGSSPVRARVSLLGSPARRANSRPSAYLAMVRRSVSVTLSHLLAEPRGRPSWGCKQRASRRLHVNQLPLHAIDALDDMHCGCSVGDTSGDFTKTHRASVEMIADVARRLGPSPMRPCCLGSASGASSNGSLRSSVCRGGPDRAGGKTCSRCVSVPMAAAWARTSSISFIRSVFACVSSSGTHQGARSSLHDPGLT